MGKIYITKDEYAPCSYILVKDGGSIYNEKDTILIQTDYDYPSLAANLGFIPCELCNETDGTIDCNHKTVSEMIASAQEFIDEHLDELFDDPGYFDEEDL